MSQVGRDQTLARYSRRGLLKRAGAGAGAVALSGAVGAIAAPRAVAARSATVSTSPTRFGRLFPELRAFAPATDAVRAALTALGKKGGLPRLSGSASPAKLGSACAQFGLVRRCDAPRAAPTLESGPNRSRGGRGTPDSGSSVMPRYIVERTFSEALAIPGGAPRRTSGRPGSTRRASPICRSCRTPEHDRRRKRCDQSRQPRL